MLQHAGSNPVPMTYVNDGGDAQVILAVAQILIAAKEQSPWSPDILSIQIDIADAR